MVNLVWTAFVIRLVLFAYSKRVEAKAAAHAGFVSPFQWLEGNADSSPMSIGEYILASGLNNARLRMATREKIPDDQSD